MIHAAYPPTPALGGSIELFWAADDYVAQAPRERVLPTGAHTLVILLGDKPVRIYADEQDSRRTAEVSHAVLCGARQTPLVISTSIGPTVGVQFKPGGARSLFDVSAETMSGRAVPLDALWGTAAGLLREQLLEARTPGARVHALQRFFVSRLGGAGENSRSVRAALQAFEEPELTSVAEVNRRTGLSPKRLLALFREEVGLSPKAYWRVRRFRAALDGLGRGLGGAALAQQHGYCDQSHFLREFRAFTGTSPTEYLATRVAGTDHVSLYR